MKRSRFSVEQIVAVLKQAELGMAIPDLIRKVGISEQTFYRWKKQYNGLQPDQARELKQLQGEDARLKKQASRLSSGEVMSRYADETNQTETPAFLRRKSSEGTGRKT